MITHDKFFGSYLKVTVAGRITIYVLDLALQNSVPH